MKKLVSLLLALVLVLGLVACGASDKPAEPVAPAAPAEPAAPAVDESNPLYTKPTEEVALTVWYAVSGVTATKFEALVNEYAAANPNVKIELSYAGNYADAANKISANLLTNTAPDVALTSAGAMFTGDRGDFTIETLIQDPAFDADGIYEGVWEYCMWQGRVCALPYGISVPVLYYNKDITAKAGLDLEKNPPKTWDELYAMAEKCVADGGAMIGVDTNDQKWIFKTMLAQNGNAIIEVDGDDFIPVYNGEGAKDVADYWQKLTNNGLMPVDQHSNAQKNFEGGQTAFFLGSSIRLARWTGVEGIADFGCLPMPSFAQESVALGGNTLVVFPNGDNAKLAAAWDLLKFLLSEEKSTDFALTTGYIPVYKNSAENEAVKAAVSADPRRQVVFDSLADGWAYTNFTDMGTMDTHINTLVSEIENGADTQEALDKAVQNLLDDM